MERLERISVGRTYSHSAVVAGERLTFGAVGGNSCLNQPHGSISQDSTDTAKVDQAPSNLSGWGAHNCTQPCEVSSTGRTPSAFGCDCLARLTDDSHNLKDRDDAQDLLVSQMLGERFKTEVPGQSTDIDDCTKSAEKGGKMDV